jgi:hypothetical protein|tara:strand:- start:581 stop:817 length:237 start_codon:yes stop_codon:yes gene_type:complete
MKDDVTYTQPSNTVMVRSDGDLIYVICSKEKQQKQVIKQMCTDSCVLEYYEEWDDDVDRKWILTFRVLDEYEKPMELN